MIFASKNEDGIPAWKMVLDGTKTVTRRTTPQPVGAVRAIQAKRTGKAIGQIKILSCQDDEEWCDEHIPKEYKEEAAREGFKKWENLWGWLKAHNKKNLPLYRIAFEVVKA